MSDEQKKHAPMPLTRRQMLQRLGLTAGIAYASPVLTGLGNSAASSLSSFSRPRRIRQPPPEIVVLAPDAATVDLIEAQGFRLIARDRMGVSGGEIARFSLPAGTTLTAAREQILGLAPAVSMDLNHLYQPGELACDAEGCIAFSMTGWSPTPVACASGIAIGMIDTGVNVEHEALAGSDLHHFSVVGPDRQPSSRMHGTAIAVLLAGRSDTRTPGLLPDARLVAADAFHANEAGQDTADAYDVARALDRLVEADIRVINLSFAGPANSILASIIDTMLERDIALVAAAGNSGPNAEPQFPAAHSGVVAVTAIDRDRRPYRQAAAGEHIDFAAPGVRLWTAASIRGGRFRSGTSYAAPFVTAALAATRAEAPEADVAQAVSMLADRSVDLGAEGRDATFGWGLVQSPEACAIPEASLFPAGGK